MAKTDDAPTYSPLDRYIIDVTEHAMEVASRPEFRDPPNKNGDIFERETINTYIQGTSVDMSKAEQMLEESIAFSKWWQKQPWYRKLWWRIRAWLKVRLSISS